MRIIEFLDKLGINLDRGNPVNSPIDGHLISHVIYNLPEEVDQIVNQSQASFEFWRKIPAPKRGELIRIFGNILRENKEELGKLVTLESGKILQEGLGEVQEMIDICDFAVGLSRQLYGLTMPSERPDHVLKEIWHPLGVVGVISAFNFPVAVWAWNFALSIVCGNSVIWKPSEKTPLTALACQKLFDQAVEQFGEAPDNLSQVILGNSIIGSSLISNPKVKLVSATGSTEMGKEVSKIVSPRFGKLLLELGGNNGMIVTKNANLDLALRAIIFSAVGTAGQRCTTLRRLLIQNDIYEDMVEKLKKVYYSITVGNPFEEKTLVGPVIDRVAFEKMQKSIEQARKEGSISITGGKRVQVPGLEMGYYVEQALIEMPSQTPIVKQETFAPILYVMKYNTLEDAIKIHNDVSHGLSSCIFTDNLKEAEIFQRESDCGIINVNIGPSGAEIGGAFGGEKDTGGGRESGSDSWKNYMRRSTNTINFSDNLPLSQGIKFEF